MPAGGDEYSDGCVRTETGSPRGFDGVRDLGNASVGLEIVPSRDAGGWLR